MRLWYAVVCCQNRSRISLVWSESTLTKSHWQLGTGPTMLRWSNRLTSEWAFTGRRAWGPCKRRITLCLNSVCFGDCCSCMGDGITSGSARWFFTFSTRTCSSRFHSSLMRFIAGTLGRQFTTMFTWRYTTWFSLLCPWSWGQYWSRTSTTFSVKSRSTNASQQFRARAWSRNCKNCRKSTR